jgi:hypothetical protein
LLAVGKPSLAKRNAQGRTCSHIRIDFILRPLFVLNKLLLLKQMTLWSLQIFVY